MSRELDARVAEVMGWRFWLEQRGDYRLAVNAKPGECNPWERTRKEYQQPERYTTCTAIEAEKAGWFGRQTPRFSTDPAACEEVKKAMLDRGWVWDVEVFKKEFGHLFKASVFRLVNARPSVIETSTEYKSICLAFLAAVEAEKGAKQQ